MLARLTIAALISIGCAHSQKAPRAPSIVFFLADDLGWADLGHAGSTYHQSPNLDRLAASGMRFLRAYSAAPNCAPTRACLMTGRSTPRHGIYTVGSGARGRAEHRKLIPVRNATTLSEDEVTIAEILREAGHRTGHFGKWHLGESPTTQGFEVNAAGNERGHPRSYFSPYANPELPDGPPGEHLTDRLAREALAFLEGVGEEPFFLYFPFFAVHTPLQAVPEIEERYRAAPRSETHSNPKYAAMIDRMDHAVGRILAGLDALGRAEDTIVIFTSDNGGLGGYGVRGARNVTSNAPLRGGKGQLYEGGVRVPLLVHWPGVTRPGSVSELPVTSVDFLPTLLEMTGIQVVDFVPRDGASFVAELREPGSTNVEARPLFFHFPGYLEANARLGTWRTTPAGAIVRGRHKLIEFFEDSRLELYDLEEDVAEARDLAEERPEVAAELHALLRAWRAEVGAKMPDR